MARKAKKTLEDKVREEYEHFYQEVIGLSVGDLEKRLATYAKEREKVDVAMDQDVELKETRAKAKDLAAPYNESKKALKLKNKFIVQLISDKGGDV